MCFLSLGGKGQRIFRPEFSCDTEEEYCIRHVRGAAAWGPDEAVLVALNMSGEKQTVNLDLKAQGLVGRKFRTLLDTGFIAGKSAEAHSFSLEPFGVYIAESSK